MGLLKKMPGIGEDDVSRYSRHPLVALSAFGSGFLRIDVGRPVYQACLSVAGGKNPWHRNL